MCVFYYLSSGYKIRQRKTGTKVHTWIRRNRAKGREKVDGRAGDRAPFSCDRMIMGMGQIVMEIMMMMLLLVVMMLLLGMLVCVYLLMRRMLMVVVLLMLMLVGEYGSGGRRFSSCC